MAAEPLEPGRKVVYRPPHVPRWEPGEKGVVTSVTPACVFVRFGKDVHAKACPRESLEIAASGPAAQTPAT